MVEKFISKGLKGSVEYIERNIDGKAIENRQLLLF